MTHTLTLNQIEPVTHDVHCLRFDKPEGFTFEPGQAVELALDRDGWRDEARPFTMTSLPEDDFLEFTIKSYSDHGGVTEQIGKMRPGDKVIVGDVFGAITDAGPGAFIAGGAGVTPFIAILRRRQRDDALDGCTLIFSNRLEKDIIRREEFEGMDGLKTVFTVTDEAVDGLFNRMIDGDMLDDVLEDYDRRFYVCGPPPMIDAVVQTLKDKGVPDGRITIETA